MTVTGKTSGTSAGIMYERWQKRTNTELEIIRFKCVAKQAVSAGTDRESDPKFLAGWGRLSKWGRKDRQKQPMKGWT